MLLLVLILVLIAFGLLVVALLSGSVLWAWVSVGVSVAAAAVLLIDWLQRRSAVRAGAEAAAAPVTELPRTRSHDPEPVTEVLPVIPRSADTPGRTPAGATGERYDDASDTTKTVVMPVVQPSASAEQPSSASHENAWSSGDSSLSVTKSGSPATPDTPSTGAGDEASAGDDAGPATAAPTTAAPTAATSTTGEPAAAEPSASAPPTVSPGAPPTEAVTNGRVGGPAGDSPTTVAPDAGEPEGVSRGTDAAGTSSTEEPAEDEPVAAGSDAPKAGVETAGAVEPAESAPEKQGSDTAAAPAATNGTASEDGAADAAAAPPGDAEPPEEQRDPAAAAVVAGLENEVLVVDEQPRYHLSSCRALTGKATIPLPAREAVELGFTPCGWCSPVRTLAAQETATR